MTLTATARNKLRASSGRAEVLPADDPQWYKDAIIYEVRTRSFYDSNGDGIGDLVGLTEKLDYLHDLGITALWLLPLCASPGRDDGYDISDYFDVHPDVGTVSDFRRFVDEAHRRGIRVITELVCNHTSDQHAWFQRARRAPAGSVERDFYVWSDTADKYREARIIFKDFEPSNWTWDPVAKAYYWHRFFSHQPDLNFENPAVKEALFKVVDFWLGMGVDGIRLDAVPYLYEEEGTNCENLPATHAYLKELRSYIDSKFAARMILAEANQWPEDAAAYFGDGDECHMNFHFPIMPRMFMAIHMEDRFPIIDILAQTPQLHPSCQWAMFLRNHDELTLEMVTDEERDYMYRAYAHEHTMRINLGIRRRLAPLVGNDRKKMELLNGLLFSLPGTPVLYYGDEIGMGDNVYLGDRNGVRTPMQWSMDRNAGFSRANPQKLILPINIDPEYHYESLNVEAQQNNPNSLLWWTKRLIALRKRFRAFGRGTIDFLTPVNPRILAFVRQYEEETILVVANLSRFVQYAEMDLGRFRGMVPLELFGRTKFPAIGEQPYLLTLGGHSFYWFSLTRAKSADADERMSLYDIPSLESPTLEGLFDHETEILEEVLLSFLVTRPWFAGRGRVVASCKLTERVIFVEGKVGLVFLQVEYAEGEPETYVVPLAIEPDVGPGESRIPPHAVIATLHASAVEGVRTLLLDALEAPAASRAFVDAIAAETQLAGRFGAVLAVRDEPIEDLGEPRLLSVEHQDTTLQYAENFVLKFFRRREEGESTELEVLRFLSKRAPDLVPGIVGHLAYRRGREEPMTLGVLQRFVPNEGTMWGHARHELRRYYERVLTQRREASPPVPPARTAFELVLVEPPEDAAALIGAYTELAAVLGRRTAEMHLALASSADEPSFAPEPFSSFDRRSVYQSMRNLTGTVLRAMRAELPELAPALGASVRSVLEHEADVFKLFEPLLARKLEGLRARVHGDYHLGQVLYTGKDVAIIDFEGDRRKALSERRRKRTPLRDVAGMLYSFQLAAFTALLDTTAVREADRALVLPWAVEWQLWVSAAFLRAYLTAVEGAPFVAKDREETRLLLDVFVLSKAFHEVETQLRAPVKQLDAPFLVLSQLLGTTAPF